MSLHQDFVLFVDNMASNSQQPRRLCCQKCRFSTKDPELFERHSAHHKEVTFTCTLCNHVSFSRVESQRHAVIHRGAFPYRCGWCPYGAVRRDYMVKHIQRIHGEAADGNFTDCPEPKTDLDTTRTSDGPPRNTMTEGCSAALVPGVGQSRPGAPYLISKSVQPPTRNQICFTTTPPLTSTTSSAPQPHIWPQSIHTKVTQATTHPPGVLFNVSPAGELIKRTSSSALPRVNVGVPADRCLHHPKPPFQTPATGTMKKNMETIPKIHVALPVPNNHQNNHQNINKPLQAVLSNPHQAPAAQIPLSSGLIRNHPETQRPVPSGPSSNGESFGRGVAPKQKTRPNILSKASASKSSSRSSVHVKSQPTVPRPEKRTPPGSNVQVELLEPLHQPLQHNKPLMVSCPEEINIPAGCLVELVEVKNVNGARELELRLVPQQLQSPTLREGSRSTGATGASDRLSFKCRVTPDQQAKPSRGPSNLHEPSPHRSKLKNLLMDTKARVKSEPELNLLCSSMKEANAPRPSGSRSAALLTPQQCDGNTNVMKIRRAVRPRQRSGGQITSPGGRNRGVSARNQTTRPESTSEGFPVISSVFSLCPVPQTNQSPTSRVTPEKPAGKTKELSDPSTNGCPNSTENWRVYRLDLKSEGKPTPLTDHAQRSGASSQEKKKEEQESNASADVKLKKSYQTLTDVLKNAAPHPAGDPAPNPPQKKKESIQSENVSPAPRDLLSNSSLNPIVSLFRIPNLEASSLSRPALDVSRGGEESVMARPVLYHTSEEQNLQERSIKLVLKRKRADMEPTDSQLDLLYVDFLPDHKKTKKTKKRTKKRRSSREQQITTGLWLTPLKPDQLVRCPGPDQPVVVLNHPSPRVMMDSSSQTGSASDQNITTTFQTVDAAPAVKMTLKKVRGQRYEVTELLLKGVAERRGSDAGL